MQGVPSLSLSYYNGINVCHMKKPLRRSTVELRIDSISGAESSCPSPRFNAASHCQYVGVIGGQDSVL